MVICGIAASFHVLAIITRLRPSVQRPVVVPAVVEVRAIVAVLALVGLYYLAFASDGRSDGLGFL